MKFEIRESRYISFPFELKDEFRAAFPRAKWNTETKEWSVAKAAAKRLEQWADTVKASGALEALELAEIAELSEADVRRLQAALNEMKHRITQQRDLEAVARAAKSRADEIREHLSAMSLELQKAADARAIAAAAADAANQEIITELSAVADIEEIEGLRRGMRSDWRAAKAVNRERFEEKQRRLREIRSQLETVEIGSRALDLAIAANFNRPDRDTATLNVSLEFARLN
ncbi:hypothetical protein [Sedimentimonas flavescens]|uniref:hypothetical protein n=1 Tax=Sedimentimonas flavescens TaxID=2851012 RepID=UPI001C4A5B93|nr:hypothetical protein [Sedimentimonas flavescens]MBW0157609.1 hypothetical protein [Sedimentimonas flavescens]